MPVCPRFTLRKAIPSAFPHTFLRHSVSQSVHSGTGILTCFPFAFAALLMLRSRLPQGGQTFPWKPWTSGRRDSRLLLATHSCILTSDTSSIPYRTPSTAYRTLSYQTCCHASAASVHVLAPLYLRRRYSRPVSYYALFQGMAASKPTSWLSVNIHLLSHLDMIWDLSRRSGLFPSRPRTLSSVDSLPVNNIRYSQFA